MRLTSGDWIAVALMAGVFSALVIMLVALT